MSIVDTYKSLRDQLLGTQPDDGSDKLQDDYFQVFSGVKGRAVLTDILQDLHAFSEVVNDEDVALNNYSRLLMAKIGIIRGDNTSDVVDMLMKVAPRIK